MRAKKRKFISKKGKSSLKKVHTVYFRIREILKSAHLSAARSVNTAQVIAYWLIGREIVEEEQKGKTKADYGKRLIAELSEKLLSEVGVGYSVQNLWLMRQFYLSYPQLLSNTKIPYALRRESSKSSEIAPPNILYALRRESWQAGNLSQNLSWTHYRVLLRVEKPEIRSFYEIEASRNNWTARELERQIGSLLFERLALSKDKKGVIKLSKKGQEILSPKDIFKDPLVMEFLGIPSSHRLVESDLEQALLGNLQAFLLELGKGFAFISRQERLTMEGDHYYIDLVFYHIILKCYVLIDLKTHKLTHQDLGQLQLYVNYFDRERRVKGDNPTLGLILCTDKNDTAVKYTLGANQQKTIFASRYKLYLPTEKELKAEIERELRANRYTLNSSE